MKNFSRRYRKPAIGLLFLLFSLALVLFLGASYTFRPDLVQAKITPNTEVSEPAVLSHSNPQIQAVMAIQNHHTSHLMAHPEVVGTATGVTDAGLPAILVFTHKEVAPGVIPENLEGVPVEVKVTGEIMAMPSKSVGGINPAGWFPRPVPTGVSTGNIGECSAGTISARVKDASGMVYALSNNHVYALENSASIGSSVLQPGRYDTKCSINTNNIIGTLAKFNYIDFSGGPNTIDAAIALSSTTNLSNGTPTNGYGTPASTIVTAGLSMPVQKYGRTTSLTKGTVVGINSTVKVSYSSGTALFVNQIVVNGKSFIKAGDSGSLLVTNDNKDSPVGLLFAGNGSGTYAWANPIGPVLLYLGISIDGK